MTAQDIIDIEGLLSGIKRFNAENQHHYTPLEEGFYDNEKMIALYTKTIKRICDRS